MQDNFVVVLPTVSIRPNQIVSYNTFSYPAKKEIVKAVSAPGVQKIKPVQFDFFDDVLKKNPHAFEFEKSVTADILPAVKKIRNHHNFELSKQGQKNLRDKVSWLYYFAKNQTITTDKGKVLSGFKMNFVTLKLPSAQRHSSDFITKNCLNQLITELSSKWGFKNYVWRLEYQKNGNLHYHIATDVFIDFYWLRSTWNRILNKFDYVSVYKKKFENMTFQQYLKNYDRGGEVNFEILQKRYVEGKKSGWLMPNSVDVKCVSNAKNIAFYISKYMGKSGVSSSIKKLPVHEENSTNSRLWFCSRSLSKLKAVREFSCTLNVDLWGAVREDHTVKKVVHDYCTSFYFCFTQIGLNLKRVVAELLRAYGVSTGYLPPHPADAVQLHPL